MSHKTEHYSLSNVMDAKQYYLLFNILVLFHEYDKSFDYEMKNLHLIRIV